MSRPSHKSHTDEDESPNTMEVFGEVVRDAGNVSRLVEFYYLVQEPDLLEIMYGLSKLPARERTKLKNFLAHPHSLLRIREDADKLVLEWRNQSRSKRAPEGY